MAGAALVLEAGVGNQPSPARSGVDAAPGTTRRLRVLVHDYAGHSYMVRLARSLSDLGLDVSHVSFAGMSTPKGRVARGSHDPPNFKVHELRLSSLLDKDNLVRRLLQQREYARLVARYARAERPDVIMSSNAPLEVQQALLTVSRQRGAGFVFWCQDIQSEAIGQILARRSPLLGRAVGAYYRHEERKLLRGSDELIVIAADFKTVLGAPPWNLDTSSIRVIENIAPLDELPQFPRDNDWALANMRPARRRIVYSGTLARKHNPDLILALARSVDADVWLFSEGSGPNYVAERARREGLDNVFVRPWLSVEDLPKALSAGDILYAVIEPHAAVFSVPSKVLSYLAAGRAILASLPPDNLAGETILRAGAGLISDPGDDAALLDNARRLLADDALRSKFGASGRRYAEKTFDMTSMGRKFADILHSAAIKGSLR